jgi:hypothetical protein
MAADNDPNQPGNVVPEAAKSAMGVAGLFGTAVAY